eukprot:gene8290-17051_t
MHIALTPYFVLYIISFNISVNGLLFFHNSIGKRFRVNTAPFRHECLSAESKGLSILDFDDEFTLVLLDDMSTSSDTDEFGSRQDSNRGDFYRTPGSNVPTSTEVRPTLSPMMKELRSVDLYASAPSYIQKDRKSMPSTIANRSPFWSQKTLGRAMVVVAAGLAIALFLVSNFDKLRPPSPEMDDYKLSSDVVIETFAFETNRKLILPAEILTMARQKNFPLEFDGDRDLRKRVIRGMNVLRVMEFNSTTRGLWVVEDK